MTVPPAIQGLLAARLERLEAEERRLLECASIEGEMFHRRWRCRPLAAGGPEAVSSRLMSLVRKELIRAEPGTLPGQDAFRFRHALIREAAYDGLSKAARSDLHERYAAWLEQTLGDRVVEAEEFLGYHLEQAYGYRAELGPVDAKALQLADGAGLRLRSAGQLAFRRGDTPAAINLLERAHSLPYTDEPLGSRLRRISASALFQAGKLERAEFILSEAIERARALGERHTELHAWLARDQLRLFAHPERVDIAESLRAKPRPSLAVFQESGDDLALARAWYLFWMLHQCTRVPRGASGRTGLPVRAPGRQPGSTRPGASPPLDTRCWMGRRPRGSAFEYAKGCCRELEKRPPGRGDRERLPRSPSLRCRGESSEARVLIESSRRSNARAGDRGTTRAMAACLRGRAETLAGDLEAAERSARAAMEHSAKIGDSWFFVSASIVAARAVCDQGDPAECLRILDESERHPSPPEWEIVVKRPALRALGLARLGRLEEAEAFAREAVGYAEGTEYLGFHADALCRSGRGTATCRAGLRRLQLHSSRRPTSSTRRGTSSRQQMRAPCSRAALSGSESSRSASRLSGVLPT